MRKTLALVAVMTVSALSLSPSLASSRNRTETREYTLERAKVHVHESDPWAGTQQEAFVAGRGERSVVISVEDSAGHPVRARVEVGSHVFEFCSEMTKPLPVRAGQEVGVSAVFGTCDGSPSVVTQGTITATFTKRAP